jgi:phosphatidylserine/phosphatidylglycerophosphate/cardiolipin synthase-like enzyme
MRGLAVSLAATVVSGIAVSGSPPAHAGAGDGARSSVPTRVGGFVAVAGPAFGDPTAAHNTILSRLLDNIRHTPSGATIQMVGYSFSLNNVATALLAAHARGVDVQVVMNGHSRQWSPAHRLVPVLGTDVTQPSFFVLTHGSARGKGGVTHQKSWSFSQVGQTRDVVMVGSTNLTGYGTEVQYSDNYVYTNRADVYDLYQSLFALQKLDVPVLDPFVSSRFADGSVYFFPKPGTTAATDPARLAITALPGNRDTTIRVAQFAWYGPRGVWLAQALAAKKRAGASVTVIAGESVGGGVREALTAVGIPIYSGVYKNGKKIHTKLMLASYKTGGVQQKSIWTGSDNWADQSFGNDDDVLQILDDASGYARYVSFFNLLTRRAAPLPPPSPIVKRDTTLTGNFPVHRVHRLRPAVLSGTVWPNYGGRAVIVQRHRYNTPGWQTVGTVKTGKGASAYHVRVPTRDRGLWRYVAIVRATTTATGARAQIATLRVMR